MTGKVSALPRRNPSAEGLRATVRMAAYPLFAGLLLVAVLVGITVGPVPIGPDQVMRVLLRHLGLDVATAAVSDTIIWQIRLPRVLLAGLVGATLGYSGAAYQGVFRNPLADPYVMGVAAGAGLAAALVIVSPVPALYANVSLITLAAFGGAVVAVGLAYSLVARVGRATPTSTLVLSGVAISNIAVSATSYLMLANDRDAGRVLSWLLGGFNDAGWAKMWYIVPYTLPAAAVIFLHGRIMNVLQLDEQEAQQLGVNVGRTRLVVLIAASLAAAAAVSVAGIVGFVGLIIPHAVRLVAGPDYRRLLPLSALLGASILIFADLGARTVLSPRELPIGVITAFVGAPLFLVLLRRQRSAFL